jgi:DNA-binding CsgD family transcriptional regulator
LAVIAGDLERGREAYRAQAWKDAHALLSSAGETSTLETDDLELLATAAFMLGRDHEYVSVLERAHHAYLANGEPLRAVRCAVWCAMILLIRGEVGPGSAWLGRARRLLEREGGDSAEHGYILMPLVFEREARGDLEGAAAVAGEAAAIAERFGDADGFALASHAQGSMLIKAGQVREGMALLDQSMLSVMTDELSPIVSGIVYCGVILACQEVFEVRRAREWTAALTRWCASQPDLVAFTGRCLVHRAEILQLGGAWADALDEAKRARHRFFEAENLGRVGLALYREGELQRLLGDFDASEQAYREASRYGWDPQPGLAQLRFAQGRADAALSTLQRALDETSDPLRRAGLLPAYVEIVLASGAGDAAHRACEELEGLADHYESAMLGAIVAHARGAVHLAEGDFRAALVTLRRAAEIWQQLAAPYEVARSRELIGLACRGLGDEEAASLELEAARVNFEELKAAPDAARVAAEIAPGQREAHGLTARELEVLRLVAAGSSNRRIAQELVISEHTVARHVQNIFGKLDVSSRTAAASFAFEHELV